MYTYTHTLTYIHTYTLIYTHTHTHTHLTVSMDEAEFIRQVAQLRMQYGQHHDSKRGRGQHPAKGHHHAKGHGLTSTQMDVAIRSRMTKPLFSNTRIFVLMITISVSLMKSEL